MIHYFTSHGQALSRPSAVLTKTGILQTQKLAEHLKEAGFCGIILPSPDEACIATGEIIARATGAALSKAPLPLLGETEGGVSKEFVAKWYRACFDAFPEEDLIFLTSREICDTLIDLFELKKKQNTRQYNCALTSFNPVSWRVVPVVYDTSFLPYEIRTLEERSAEELDREFFFSPYAKEIPTPDLSEFKGERILHIGDTESAIYPYYKKLFELTKPDIILHTGDVADEVKMERHPEARYEYKTKCACLIQMMRESGARMIFVVGNHDVPEILKELAPEAEIYMPGSEVVLSGVPCRVGHKVKEMVFDRQYCLYGHGMAGERWRYGFNVPGKPCRFNVAFGSFLYDLANDRFVRFPRITANDPE